MNELSLSWATEAAGTLEVCIVPVGGEVGVWIYGFTFRPFSVCLKQSSAVHIFLPSQVLLRRMLVLRETIPKETKYSVKKCYLLGLREYYLLGLRGYLVADSVAHEFFKKHLPFEWWRGSRRVYPSIGMLTLSGVCFPLLHPQCLSLEQRVTPARSSPHMCSLVHDLGKVYPKTNLKFLKCIFITIITVTVICILHKRPYEVSAQNFYPANYLVLKSTWLLSVAFPIVARREKCPSSLQIAFLHIHFSVLRWRKAFKLESCSVAFTGTKAFSA